MRTFLAIFTLVMLQTGAGRAEVRPVIKVEPITITSPADIAATVRNANELMRAQHEVPLFLRAYFSPTLTGEEMEGFLLSPSLTMAGLLNNEQQFVADPASQVLREKLRAISRTGPARIFKSIRFDGTHSPGWLNNYVLHASDETELLACVERLAASLTFDENEPVYLNVFRLISGPGSETHFVSINAGSAQALGDQIDQLTTLPDPLDSPTIRVLSRTIYSEARP
ncbi:MAG: hypothetical protein SynsKO_01760 [Synoicihabitans sp.]